MQTRNQAENVVYNQADVGSQVDRESRYKMTGRKMVQKKQKSKPKSSRVKVQRGRQGS